LIGKRLAHYEITGSIGKGGMGEVYRARDNKLGRDVAIKVLPTDVSGNPERLARFDREARTLATLQHPNIASIYGFESVDHVRFLVMELVDGEDLSQRRGPMPVDEVVDLAIQLAEGLAAAHAVGIIHRDLKPANIKVSSEGKLKILDFGLARTSMDEHGSGTDLQHSPTLAGMTQAGVILGTAAYMSPEQARGKRADHRADIWAYGVVLFEMLTGKRLFVGETASDTLAGVLRADVPWDELPHHTPTTLRRLLQRCLERDVSRRLQAIAEARIALEDLKAGRSGEAVLQAKIEVEPAASARKNRGWLWAAAGLIGGGLLGLLAGTVLLGNGEKAAAPQSLMMRRLTELPGPEMHPHLSPDGRQLIYSSSAGGNVDVYLLRVGGDRAINLTAGSPADDSQGKFSPDGEKIVFRSERDGGGLFTMGATGESVRRVTDSGMDPSWSPDGRRLAFGTEAVDDPYSRLSLSTLWTVEVATGQKKQLTTTGDAVQPAWSPDGRHIAYWANTGGQRDIWMIASEGGDPVAVTQDHFTDWSPVWSPDGRWLFFSSDRGGSMNVWRLPVDAGGVPQGDAQPVTTGTQSMGWAAFSEDGRRMVAMAYDRTNEVSFFELARLRRGEMAPLRRLKLQSGTYCTVSPDAEWMACSTRGAHEDLVLLRSDGSEMRRLTDDEHKDRVASWTPDGQALVFYSTRSGAWNYWWIRTDGSGLRQITAFSDFNGGVLSPDGKQVALNADYRGLVVVDVNVSKPVDWKIVQALPMPEAYPEAMFGPAAWSPDGRLIAGYETSASGLSTGYAIYDLQERSLRRLALTSGSVGAAGWLPDSRNLVLRGAAGVVIYDTVAGTTRTILAEPNFSALGLARAGEVLMVQHELLDSEIWLLDFE
jgi:Tol biopolymer transport system component